MHREDDVEIQGEHDHLEAKERSLRGKQFYRHHNLRSLTSRIMRNEFMLFKSSGQWYFIMAALLNEYTMLPECFIAFIVEVFVSFFKFIS